MRKLHRSNGHGKEWTRETIFVKKKILKKKFENFATVTVKVYIVKQQY